MEKNELTLKVAKNNKDNEKSKKENAKRYKNKLRATNKRYFFAKIKYFLSSTFDRAKIDVQDFVEEREIRKLFENNCKQTYTEFLELANATSEKTGIENYENELGKGIVVYSEFGPFLRLDIDPKKSQSKKHEIVYEGFMKESDGKIMYNFVTLFPIEFDSKFAFGRKPYYNAEGFKLDPTTMKPEQVLKFQQETINPYEFYFKSLISKQDPKDKATNPANSNIIEFKQTKKSDNEIGFNL